MKTMKTIYQKYSEDICYAYNEIKKAKIRKKLKIKR